MKNPKHVHIRYESGSTIDKNITLIKKKMNSKTASKAVIAAIDSFANHLSTKN